MEHTYFWLSDIIKSCNNGFHFRCADVLISLFIIKYGNNDKAEELQTLRQHQWNAVHGILI
jgi:hypothetical protein